MRRALLTTATLIATAVPALAGNWYIVAGATGHCAISQFTPDGFKAAVMNEPGSDPAVVTDKSDPKGDGGVVELAVKNNHSDTVKGLVFVNNAALCESIAQLMVETHMMPSEIREALTKAPR